VREGRPHEHHVRAAGDLEVVEVFGGSGQDRRVLQSPHGVAEDRARFCHVPPTPSIDAAVQPL
jgi:hypothetical protein